jgi:hypothetical protein
MDTHAERLLYVHSTYLHRNDANARSVEADFGFALCRDVTRWPILQKWLQPSAHFG